MFALDLSGLRAEARANLRLAVPIVLAQFTFMGMGTVDTIMAGRLGADVLAAVAVGANVWFLVLIVFMGILMSCSPIVAQRIGASRNPFETGRFVREAAVFSVGLGIVWMLVMRAAAGPVLAALALGEPASQYAGDYITVASWGAIPFSLCFVARNVAEGHGLTRAALLAGLVGFAVNGVFDYVLMYGKLGMPALGPSGCAWASNMAGVAMLVTYAVLFGRLPQLRALQFWVGGWPALGSGTREILRLGLPIALIVAAESWLFNIGALLMARFGSDVIAAHQVAINVAALSFMVPLSIGFATTVRVGYAAGAGDAAAVRIRGQTGMLLGVSFALFSASIMALFPAAIVALYTDALEVSAIAAGFLYYAALFQLFDCVQATAAGALRGIKDTRLPMMITVSAYWVVGMPVAWLLSFRTGLGPSGVWWGFIVALAVAAAGLATRFLRLTRAAAPQSGAATT